jgi:hypothetical protein
MAARLVYNAVNQKHGSIAFGAGIQRLVTLS